MATSTVSLSYGVTDAKVAVITADPEGGSPTYASSVDIPGITKVNIKIALSKKVLRGDNKVLATQVIITGVTADVEFAKNSLDLLAAMLSGTVTTSGTTPNEVANWALTDTSTAQPFRLQAVNAAADPVNGNGFFELCRCILTGFDGLGAADDEFTTPKMTVDVVPLLSTGDWCIFEVHETATTLA